MLVPFRLLNSTVWLILFLFLGHGLLYYVFPQQHYLTGGGGVLQVVKYPLFLLIIVVVCSVTNLSRSGLLVVSFFYVLGLASLVLGFSDEKLLIFLAYLFPIIVFLIPISHIKNNRFYMAGGLIYLCFSLLVVNFFGALYEFFFGPVFDSYSRSSFRAVGIFVNPNNSAIFVVILFSVLAALCKSYSVVIISFFLTFLSLLLLGSKTGFVVFFVAILLFYPLIVITFSLLLAAFFVLFPFDFSKSIFDTLRSPFDMESGFHRLTDWRDFLDYLASLSFKEILLSGKEVFLIDNSYMDLLANFGAIVLFAHLVMQFISIVMSLFCGRLAVVLSLIFFISMLSTNIHRLWPLSYVFWLLVSWNFYSFSSNYLLVNKVRKSDV